MIVRLWRGWTSQDDAAAYAALLRTTVLPGIHRIAGYRGAWLLRRDVAEGVEFVTLTLWDSMDAVRAFAGPDADVAVVPPAARDLLARFDQRSTHYDTVMSPA